jgi:hypothetical protein
MHRDFAIMHEIDPKDPEKKKKKKAKAKAKEEAYINEKKKESKKNKEEEEDGFGKAINTYKRLGNVRHRRRLCLSFFAMFLSPCLFVGLVV